MTIKSFLLPHIRELSRVYNVFIVLNASGEELLSLLHIDAKFIYAPIERNFSPVSDLYALYRLMRVFHSQQFDVVHSITPKAGLLCSLAAYITGVPIRIHSFTGQVWATRIGLKRYFLKIADRVIATLSTYLLIDSASQRDFLISERVITSMKSAVLGFGSIAGVDVDRFKPNPHSRIMARSQFNIPEESVVIVFVGRLNIDKGILDLIQAFSEICVLNSDAWLLVVGPDEGKMVPKINALSEKCGRVTYVPYTQKPEFLIVAGDIFCLPSYREGFGSSVIEAAACGLPAVVSNIYGLTDAVIDGLTGIVTPPHAPDLLKDSILALVNNKMLRRQMGKYARERVLNCFREELVTLAMLKFYKSICDPR